MIYNYEIFVYKDCLICNRTTWLLYFKGNNCNFNRVLIRKIITFFFSNFITQIFKMAFEMLTGIDESKVNYVVKKN